MLRKWNPPVATAGFADEIAQFDDEDEVVCWKEDGTSYSTIRCGVELTSPMKQQMEQLVEVEFADVFKDSPGSTDIVEHDIRIKEASPIKQPPYRILCAYREEVKQELKEILNAGIIEESNSEWASPIVLVRKKDKSLRLCVDYRRLNAVSEMEPYPMPRIEDLLDRIGRARFLTTLDLAKGYILASEKVCQGQDRFCDTLRLVPIYENALRTKWST